MKSPDYNPAALAADHFKALKTGDGALACSLPGVAGSWLPAPAKAAIAKAIAVA